jgi:hypothetical protein
MTKPLRGQSRSGLDLPANFPSHNREDVPAAASSSHGQLAEADLAVSFEYFTEQP